MKCKAFITLTFGPQVFNSSKFTGTQTSGNKQLPKCTHTQREQLVNFPPTEQQGWKLLQLLNNVLCASVSVSNFV